MIKDKIFISKDKTIFIMEIDKKLPLDGIIVVGLVYLCLFIINTFLLLMQKFMYQRTIYQEFIISMYLYFGIFAFSVLWNQYLQYKLKRLLVF